ncbi:hypothetical protein J2857_003639 [Neorhizobium galegae]|uniref:hypothetical protein n=1 Tax=Neorhizobium galegae TaxID=399 RepID=UPI001AE6E5A3|nr:hypothetical protein [Neorhizobium galegae]MBP2560870.1 hypothetical protein [Neorhizobium galegae]
MSTLPDFIAELVRAANEVGKCSEFERGNLLDRAYRAIRDGRDQVGTAQDSLGRDPSIDFLTMSRSMPMFSDEEIKAALLEAAGMVRALRIIIDAKNDAVLNSNEGESTPVARCRIRNMSSGPLVRYRGCARTVFEG